MKLTKSDGGLYVVDDQALFDEALARLVRDPIEAEAKVIQPTSLLLRPDDTAIQVRCGYIREMKIQQRDFSYPFGVFPGEIEMTVCFQLDDENARNVDKLWRMGGMRSINLVLDERGGR